mmetsp:Transcript_20473/g.53447  ORF Transcript_20473/g.53447 Transcript_20473/m.53447 type:complete len:228 (-) Transcript_20473:462-1145(-)
MPAQIRLGLKGSSLMFTSVNSLSICSAGRLVDLLAVLPRGLLAGLLVQLFVALARLPSRALGVPIAALPSTSRRPRGARPHGARPHGQSVLLRSTACSWPKHVRLPPGPPPVPLCFLRRRASLHATPSHFILWLVSAHFSNSSHTSSLRCRPSRVVWSSTRLVHTCTAQLSALHRPLGHGSILAPSSPSTLQLTRVSSPLISSSFEARFDQVANCQDELLLGQSAPR